MDGLCKSADSIQCSGHCVYSVCLRDFFYVKRTRICNGIIIMMMFIIIADCTE